MGDSIKYLNDDDKGSLEDFKGRRINGNIHKGRNIVPVRSTIPTKYQTVVIRNDEKKGFTSQSKRFNYDQHLSEGPGPGNYIGQNSANLNSTSFSKKGTGGFVSKDKRIRAEKIERNPGVGSYHLPDALKSRCDFNKSNSKSFHTPIATGELHKFKTPGPNAYKPLKSNKQIFKSNNVYADAAFKSNTKREVINTDEATMKPSPCQYDVNDSLLKQTVKVPLSSFKSKTKRQIADKKDNNPGPAEYQSNRKLIVKRLLFPKQHYLSMSAPAMPLPPTPPLPGPGQYKLKDGMDAEKHYMTNAAFVSSSNRWTSLAINSEFPGPAHYNQENSPRNKQSFLYNVQQKWVC